MHWLQGNGFAPVCTRMCTVKLCLCANRFVHWLHGKGFSPVCVRICLFNVLRIANCFVHWLHANSFATSSLTLSLTSSIPSFSRGVVGVGLTLAFRFAGSVFALLFSKAMRTDRKSSGPTQRVIGRVCVCVVVLWHVHLKGGKSDITGNDCMFCSKESATFRKGNGAQHFLPQIYVKSQVVQTPAKLLWKCCSLCG